MASNRKSDQLNQDDDQQTQRQQNIGRQKDGIDPTDENHDDEVIRAIERDDAEDEESDKTSFGRKPQDQQQGKRQSSGDAAKDSRRATDAHRETGNSAGGNR